MIGSSNKFPQCYLINRSKTKENIMRNAKNMSKAVHVREDLSEHQVKLLAFKKRNPVGIIKGSIEEQST